MGATRPTEQLTVAGMIYAEGGIKFLDGSVQTSAFDETGLRNEINQRAHKGGSSSQSFHTNDLHTSGNHRVLGTIRVGDEAGAHNISVFAVNRSKNGTGVGGKTMNGVGVWGVTEGDSTAVRGSSMFQNGNINPQGTAGRFEGNVYVTDGNVGIHAYPTANALHVNGTSYASIR